jgi:hypothetical protein
MTGLLIAIGASAFLFGMVAGVGLALLLKDRWA